MVYLDKPQKMDGICPICGREDVEMYRLTQLGNRYRCNSTGKEVEMIWNFQWIERKIV
jgi:hypothetical protein